jgi:hypothetical protein
MMCAIAAGVAWLMAGVWAWAIVRTGAREVGSCTDC